MVATAVGVRPVATHKSQDLRVGSRGYTDMPLSGCWSAGEISILMLIHQRRSPWQFPTIPGAAVRSRYITLIYGGHNAAAGGGHVD